ncbi:MAG TPA: murein biosynthesis integral membrane protein MurJ [Acidimicrobiales bacterium]
MTAPKRSGLIRANVGVATGTLASRVTGLLRLAVLGWALGQTAFTDAYNAANNAPNILYELLLGGIFGATLVPIFTDLLEKEDEDGESAIVSVAVVVLAVATALAVAAAPLVFRMMSFHPSDDVDPGAFRGVGTDLARYLLPQIFFYGCMALGASMLQARRRFFAPAWTPVLNNLVVIVVMVIVRSVADGPVDHLGYTGYIVLLGLGTTAGIAAMVVGILPSMRRAGIRIRFRPEWRHPAVGRVLRLSGWAFGFVAANLVALVVVQNLARPGSGNLTAYVMAYTFFQLPHGLLAVSITTTFVPELARAVTRRDRRSFNDRMSLGIRTIALFTLPASVGFIVLARPLVALALERGEFDASDTLATSRALTGFAVGLCAYSLYLFILRGFYAHRDGRTPFVLNLIENLVNVGLAIALVGRFDVFGLGLAYALAYLVAALLAFQTLRYKVRGVDVRGIVASIFRLAVAAAVMGAFVWLASSQVGSDSGWGALARSLVGIVMGVGVYAALLFALRVPEIEALRQRLGRATPDTPVSP